MPRSRPIVKCCVPWAGWHCTCAAWLRVRECIVGYTRRPCQREGCDGTQSSMDGYDKHPVFLSIIRPYSMRSVDAANCDRCSVVCVCVCVCLCAAVVTLMYCAKTAELIEMPFGAGADSCMSKEPCIRWGSRSDESICSHNGWRVGVAAFCQITLDTCLEICDWRKLW